MATFHKIAFVEVGAGGQANIEFTSIPQTYTDLCLKLSAKGTRNYYFDNFYLQFNGITANQYTTRMVYGLSASALSASSVGVANIEYIYAAGSHTSIGASTFGNTELCITNYTSDQNKTISTDGVSEGNIANDIIINMASQLWSNTQPITSIKLYSANGDFAQYSTATLYGISKK